MTRKTPYDHNVKKHTRNGVPIKSYDRGKGKPTPHKTLKRVQRGITVDKAFLQKIHNTRSPTSKQLDNSLRAPTAPSYDVWIHAPNEYDIPGVDTPGTYGARASQIPHKQYSDARLNMNRIGGLYRVDVWDKNGNVDNSKYGFESENEARLFINRVKKSNPSKGAEATYNEATGWTRITFDKKPSRETINKLKERGFRYRPRSKAWGAKHSLYREQLLISLAGEMKDIDIPVNNAGKAEYYQKRADKLNAESTEKYDRAKKKMSMIPMGQPILVGHHSERKHRGDLKKIDKGMKKSFELRDEAKKAQATADRFRAKMEGKENPVTILNRIEKHEKAIAKLKTYSGEDAKRMIPRIEKLLKIEKAKYNRSGGIAADKIVFRKGMKVQTSHGPALVNKVSAKSIRVKLLTANRNLQGPPWDNLKMDKKKVRGVIIDS